MDGMLSQEEINALFGSMDNNDANEGDATSPVNESTPQGGGQLTDTERDAVGEISNISMGTAATTLSTLVNNRVVITTPQVSYVTLEEITGEFSKPCVFIHISYKEGLDGKNVLILKEKDVKIITDLMMGGDGTNIDGELSDLHLSAISEAMNQMMGSASTSLSSMLDKKVDISPPVASLVDLNDGVDDESLGSFLDNQLVQVSFRMEIGDLVDSQIMQLFPMDFAKDIFNKFSSGMPEEETASVPAKQETSAPIQQPQAEPMVPQMSDSQMMNQQMMNQPMMNPQMMNPQMMNPQMMGQPMTPMANNVNIQPAQFQSFTQSIAPGVAPENIDLIMDVPLEVTVELGRSNKSIKEILDFSPGTIIELNKLAGEPIDVLVNGKFVAKGEVVVIEESFGVRVTEIIRD